MDALAVVPLPINGIEKKIISPGLLHEDILSGKFWEMVLGVYGHFVLVVYFQILFLGEKSGTGFLSLPL